VLGFVRRMRARHLFAAWAIWWLILLLRVTPAFIAVWKAMHAPPGQGNVRLSIDNGIVSLVASVGEQILWTGSMSFLAMALLAAGVPLVMWGVWVGVGPRRERESVS